MRMLCESKAGPESATPLAQSADERLSTIRASLEISSAAVDRRRLYESNFQ